MTFSPRRLLPAALCAAAVLSISGCPAPLPPPAPPEPATVVSFRADKVQIAPGESVTLAFTTRNADSVELIDQSGRQLATEGTVAEGYAVVTPEVTSFYVLKAISGGGRHSEFVQVTVGDELREVSLIAVPPRISAGEQTHLIWTAFQATGAKLSSPGKPETVLDVSSGSGMEVVTPTFSTTYALAATGQAAGTELTTSAEVKVSPVLTSFAAVPHAARAGEKLRLRWSTAGAAELTVVERLFGGLTTVSTPDEVASGELEWTIPLTLPGGAPTQDGTPLEFTLTVRQSDPETVLTRVVRGYVGEGPVVDFDAPDALTQGKDLVVSWSTQHAVRVQVKVDGLVVYEPRPQNAFEVADGEYAIRGLTRDSVVELVAWDYTGASRTERRDVQVVSAPSVGAVSVTSPIAGPGSGATVQWTTTNALEVSIRAADGPVLFSTRTPQRVASGQAKVFVAQTTELVFEAWNRAGDRAQASRVVEVTSPADFTAGPTPLLAGAQLTATWNLDPATTAAVLGVQDAFPPPVQQDSTVFIDLESNTLARQVAFADSDEGVARLRPRVPFRFPFMGEVRETFYVSTNGFLAFERTAPMAENQDLADPAVRLPAMIAPFWDDLRVGSGKVLYAIVGDAYPRSLVVEWRDVSLKATVDARTTFQLQLDETGAFRFVYGASSGDDAAGESATMGARCEDGTFAQRRSHNPGAPAVAHDDVVEWFASGSVSGGFQLLAQRTGSYGAFARTQTGDHILHLKRVQVFAPDDVIVSEAMPLPVSQSADGRWIELFNNTNRTMDLEGLELASTGGEHVLPTLMLPPGGYLLLGESQDPAASDGVTVQYVYTDLPLAPADTLQLKLGSTSLSLLDWPQAQPGKAVIPLERAIDTTGARIRCTQSTAFGALSVGTPGAANDRCFEYELQSIPGGFEDISLLGMPLPASPTYGSIPLAVPFRYFGQSFDEVRYSTTAGFVSFGAPLTTTSVTGKTKPTSSAPRGTVAPFWDYVVKPSGLPAEVFVLRRPTYTVISWQNYIVSGGTNGSLNFQVKLFDSGVIEFHYGEMRASTVSTKADFESGVSATTWIERPAGDLALPVNINTAGGIKPNSGYRFTPRT